MAVSDDVRVEPGTESIVMNVPVEMPEAVEDQGVLGCTGYVEDNGCTDWMEQEQELERGITFNRQPQQMYRLSAPASAPAPSKPRAAHHP